MERTASGRHSSPDTTSRLEHDRLTSLINSMADGVLAVDRFTNVVVYNGASLNILDSNGTILNKPLNKVLSLVDHNNQAVDVIKLVRGIKAPTVDESMKLVYDDGSRINIYLSISPVARSYGSAHQSGHVIVLRDITHAKSLAEERDEFISVVSHELRTPIAITEGNISNAQFIADKSGDIEKIKQALAEAHNQVLFLSSMINDLSTLSRAEQGKLVAELDAINVKDLVADLVCNYREEAESKGLQLHSHTSQTLELLSSSRLYVREVLQNFITNAIKYTETGSVTIGARSKPGGVQFSVSDTGIGISPSDQGKIFDKFYRSEDFRTRQHNGTGIGLYVTIKLARLLHAEIDVTSKLNKGSTFTIFIPDLK